MIKKREILEQILCEALEIPSLDRESFIEQRCDGDVSLANSLRSLLAYAESQSRFLEPPTASAAHLDTDRISATHAPATGLLPSGTRLASYTIDSLIGEGGMGAVYLARQERPQRRVALKLIKPMLFSERVHRRFELEAEILARLQHPGIASVYEVGIADATPFFAMEFIEGKTLRVHAEQESLGMHDRLHLFARVCDAVQHAHTKGVVHRDLKPANILVDVTEPRKPQPKVLDFGVARLTDSDTEGVTAQTEVGQILGTLPYMSPEQASGNPSDIDTRSDVYALGVVLYELLTGRLPHNLTDKLWHEALRTIKEDDHTRLSSIAPGLRGDLETIVAKALHKDRDIRYQSASLLAQDVRHFLGDEPITARPPSTWYQLRKFSKRNQPLVAGVAVAFAALSTGLAGTTYGLIHASAQRDHASRQKESAEEVTRFLVDDLLVQSAPSMAGRETRAIDLLERAAARIETADLRPEAEARVRRGIGMSFVELGRADMAEPHLREARTLLTRAGERVEMVDIKLAEALYRLRRFDEALSFVDSVIALPQDEIQGKARLDALAVRASCLKRLDRMGEAEDTYQRLIAGYGETGSADGIDVWITQYNLALVEEAMGKRSAAIRRLHNVIAGYERIGEAASPSRLNAKGELALILSRDGDVLQAESLFRAVLDESLDILGPEGRRTILTQVNLAKLLTEDERPDDALPLLQAALKTSDASPSGPSGGEALEIARRLALCYEQAGQPDFAVSFLDHRLEELKSDPATQESNGMAKLESLREQLTVHEGNGTK